MKKIAIAVIILGVLLSGGFYILEKNYVRISKPVPVDWLTYKNDDLKLEFKYPPTYKIKESTNHGYVDEYIVNLYDSSNNYDVITFKGGRFPSPSLFVSFNYRFSSVVTQIQETVIFEY